MGSHTSEWSAVSDMDDDSALDWILSQGREKLDKPVKTVKPVKTKMMNCSDCSDMSRKHCFKCMEDFYSHMHNDKGQAIKVEVEPAKLVRSPIDGKRHDPTRSDWRKKAVSQ